ADVGGQRVPIDVRIIAASRADIERAMLEGKLCEDLYFRLSTHTVQVPPLRERREEILVLMEHFMHRIAQDYDMTVRAFSAGALSRCENYRWPKNITELAAFVERYLHTGDAALEVLTTGSDGDGAFWNRSLELAEDLVGRAVRCSSENMSVVGLKSLIEHVKETTERNVIGTALDLSGWNRKAAARLLKVSYRALLYKIERYDMHPPTSPSNRGVGLSSL